MGLRFEQFELDGARFELRRAGAAVHVEPQVLSLIILLVRNRRRLVTRDELVEEIWEGRIISEAAISSRVKAARKALDDDGAGQRLIRTVHGRRFRFVGEVEEAWPEPLWAEAIPDPAEAAPDRPLRRPDLSRPSIAILPLHPLGEAGPAAFIADALPHELIAELSRLRWLFVIARGSSFRFRDANPDLAAIGARLGVNYCLWGTLETRGDRLTVALELSDTRDHGLVWSERYESALDEIEALKAEIVARVVAALELQIPRNEARQARLSTPGRLDAWSAYHLGLQHMYRFNRTDNEIAGRLFEQAVAQEPEFARAYAGLSFIQFQNAFLSYTSDIKSHCHAATQNAERAVAIDPEDPFCNLTLGRSLWLTGDLEGSLGWLDRAVGLSPNYAQGIYARAWAETLLGRGADGQGHADQAMALSPIDPLHYGMLATRAMSHLVRGETAEAAAWGERAVHAPGAHVLISIIATACHALNGDLDKARYWAAKARTRRPSVTQADFFRSFPFADEAVRRRISAGLSRVGI
ncbi:MAG TPA: winged helix-turn-helix domain-containing protein [Allosphingosinicella sp.]|jgi:TolB-like protein|nr:winged helix-turn-helix domain-containing protein [Allosphingosinicella sp.]